MTSPSNRVGICIAAPRDGIATILVGGSEYFANVDPRLDPGELTVAGAF